MLKLIVLIAVIIIGCWIVLKIIFPLINSLFTKKDCAICDEEVKVKCGKQSFDEEVDSLSDEKQTLKKRKEDLEGKIEEKVNKVNKLKD